MRRCLRFVFAEDARHDSLHVAVDRVYAAIDRLESRINCLESCVRAISDRLESRSHLATQTRDLGAYAAHVTANCGNSERENPAITVAKVPISTHTWGSVKAITLPLSMKKSSCR